MIPKAQPGTKATRLDPAGHETARRGLTRQRRRHRTCPPSRTLFPPGTSSRRAVRTMRRAGATFSLPRAPSPARARTVFLLVWNVRGFILNQDFLNFLQLPATSASQSH